MENFRLTGLLVAFTLLGSCATDENETPGVAGQSSAGTSGTGGLGAGSGGKAATAGTNATGGTPPTAGTNSTGGTPPTAGTNATGGTPPTAGTNSTGGTTAGAGVGGSLAGSGGSAGISSGGTAGTSGGTGGSGGSGGTDPGEQHWVGTWAASPYLAASDAQPPMSLSNAVLRQSVRVSIGGSRLRVQFSNAVGNGAVNIKTAHIAINPATGPADSTIDPATDKALSFSGMPSVTIAQGMEVWSDEIDFALPPLAKVAITTALGSVPSNLTAHAGSRTTSYITGGEDVSAANMSSAMKTDHWYFIAGIDTMAPLSASAIVAIGDSITDGRGTDTNGNNRWTDILAERLQANEATKNIAVLNQGIGATNLVGSGTAAEARFARDVLGMSGVKYAIVFDGVNDIGSAGTAFQPMKTVYDKMIAAAHDKGLKIYGGTILPFGDNSYYSASHEQVRVQVNDYIKSGAFDGYIDFDAALTDGGNPPKLQATYAAWSQMDGLHPGPAGYKKMGDSVDLALFMP